MGRIFYLLALSFLLPATVSAKDYYVRDRGDLIIALAYAQAGDTVILKDGTYPGPFTIVSGGTPTAPLIIKAQNEGKAVISGSGKEGYALGILGEARAIPASLHDLRLEGLAIRNASSTGLKISWADRVTVIRSVFAQNALNGILAEQAADLVLRGNDIQDGSGAGIALEGLNNRPIIEYNTVAPAADSAPALLLGPVTSSSLFANDLTGGDAALQVSAEALTTGFQSDYNRLAIRSTSTDAIIRSGDAQLTLDNWQELGFDLHAVTSTAALAIGRAGWSGLEAIVRPDGAAELVKGSTSAVYFHYGNGRYAFATEAIYKSWFPDFSGVRRVSDASLSSLPLRGLMHYRPGTRLVKIQTDPRVYAVAKAGTLRWITSEMTAASLFGQDWNKKIDDIEDGLFATFSFGDPIRSAADYDPAAEAETIQRPEQNF